MPVHLVYPSESSTLVCVHLCLRLQRVRIFDKGTCGESGFEFVSCLEVLCGDLRCSYARIEAVRWFGSAMLPCTIGPSRVAP